MLRYKARPLNGIWATAPYLHNSSVPTLEHLLTPAASRPATFVVSSRLFDADKVGLDLSATGTTFTVNDAKGRPIAVNSNAGHEYGTSLTPPDKRALLEYLKSL